LPAKTDGILRFAQTRPERAEGMTSCADNSRPVQITQLFQTASRNGGHTRQDQKLSALTSSTRRRKIMKAKLERIENEKFIAGVCAGVAAYLGLDPTLVRLAFLLLIPASGIGLLLYLVLWIIMPTQSERDDVLKVMAANSPPTPHPQRNSIIGIFLILVGLYLLAQTSQFAWLFWPLLLIGGGVYMLRRYRNENSG
jgi:phage shock protein PspC (stress-responsive transcriptional regulator)